jgi:hypothetical protein
MKFFQVDPSAVVGVEKHGGHAGERKKLSHEFSVAGIHLVAAPAPPFQLCVDKYQIKSVSVPVLTF